MTDLAHTSGLIDQVFSGWMQPVDFRNVRICPALIASGASRDSVNDIDFARRISAAGQIPPRGAGRRSDLKDCHPVGTDPVAGKGNRCS